MKSQSREILRFIVFDKRHYIASQVSVSDVLRISSLELPDTLVGLEVLLRRHRDKRLRALFTALWLNAESPRFEEVGKGIVAVDLQERSFAALAACSDVVFLYREGRNLRRFQSVSLDEIQNTFLARKLESYVRTREN